MSALTRKQRILNGEDCGLAPHQLDYFRRIWRGTPEPGPGTALLDTARELGIAGLGCGCNRLAACRSRTKSWLQSLSSHARAARRE